MFILADLLDQDTMQAPPSDLGVTFAKMMFTFLLLIILLLGTYWVLKRLIRYRVQSGGVAPSMHVIEKKMISPKTMLYLVEVEDRKILIAESQLEIKRLESFALEGEGEREGTLPQGHSHQHRGSTRTKR